MKLKSLLLAATLLAIPACAHASPSAAPVAPAALTGVKNVIVLINDGGGYTVYDATRLFLGHGLTTDGTGWSSTGVSTYPLRQDGTGTFTCNGVVVSGVNRNLPFSNAAKSPANGGRNQNASSTTANPVAVYPCALNQDPNTVYNSARFWDTRPVAGASTAAGYSAYPASFQGYEWSRVAHPDSGNTASTLANGNKTYNNAINVNGAGVDEFAVVDVIDAARQVGKSAGVVSVVQFGDATPAASGGAHNVARANRQAIADEMFSTGHLAVIGGAGSPDYDDNGISVVTPNYEWITPMLWADLKNNTNNSGKNPYHFELHQDRASIQALAARTKKPPMRLAMVVKGFNSTQFNRTGVNPAAPLTNTGLPACVAPYAGPCANPLKTNVPTQAEMTVAALNTLDRNGRGFYLMTEAGAVDRAEHANTTGRMIEEMVASDDTVKAIIAWVNRKNTSATWDNTILIVTADHDHLLYGPNGDTVPFQPLVDNGPGVVPGNRWFGPNHGTGLVPLFAYGKGSAQLVSYASQTDAYTDSTGHTFGHGLYMDQTLLGQVLKLTVAQPK